MSRPVRSPGPAHSSPAAQTSVRGWAIASLSDLRQELGNHLLRPVDWARTMVSLRGMHVTTVVELGPGRVLASLAAKHIPGVATWNAEELFVELA